MKNTLYWVGAGIVLVAGIAMTIYYGVQPRPVQKITLSEFQSPNVVANSILLRLREEIQQAPILLLGFEPSEPQQVEVWKQFLINNQEKGMKFDRIVVDQFLKIQTEFPGSDQTDTQENIDQLIQVLTDLQAKGQRVAVIMPTVYTSQLIDGNVADKLKKQGHLKITSMSITDFPRSREAEKIMHFPCSVEDVDQSGLGKLGCFVAQEARTNYRKKMTHDSLVGLVDQVGMSDYLVLLTKEP